ncbi:MAG TPA: ABC transporter substrate-binding protein [Acidimicrobiia bacterium]|nr:ABC transporter substrate-binding protein [Acidimicrobiia bacterium]
MALTRRDFLRMAGLAAAGAACGSGGDNAPAAARGTGPRSAKTLRIAQWTHFVPAYDEWFDKTFVPRWSERNGIEVVVDHISIAEIPSRAAAEVAAQRGHDLVHFLSPPSAFEEEVIDHADVVEEVRAKLGPVARLAERSSYNPKTEKWFSFPDYLAPSPVSYRTDLWQAAGARPDSWADLLAAGPRLKLGGHPLGIGLSQDLDSNFALLGLLHAHGASIQDEQARLTLNRPATVEAVRAGIEIYRAGMTDEVLSWDAASNNRFLASGKGSLIINPVSALRAVEKQDPELARTIALAPALAGPAGRFAPLGGVGSYVIWRFAANPEAAKQLLVDLAGASREALVQSELFGMPTFADAVPDLDGLLAADARAEPADKYSVLADFADWSTNLGHPGSDNPAIDEVFNGFLIPQMFAAAARGEMSPEETVRAAEQRIQAIYDKWRQRGMV